MQIIVFIFVIFILICRLFFAFVAFSLAEEILNFLRFEFETVGVSETEFRHFWRESFSREMMTYPVLNRLDKEQGIQYYFQKGNLMIRDKNGSRMEKIEREKQTSVLSKIFNLSPEVIEKALMTLDKIK